MNHDMMHCADYRKSRCPKRCFRARLTRELFERQARGELAGVPMSFAHLRGTAECWEGTRTDSIVKQLRWRGNIKKWLIKT